MIIAIFVIVLLAAGVFGYFLVKKERRKQLERRAAKVKIAEGIFDVTAEAAPAAKARRKKKKMYDADWIPPVPEYLVNNLRNELTVLLQNIFSQIKAVNDTSRAATAAGDKLSRAQSKLNTLTYTLESGPAQVQWLQNRETLQRAIEQAHVARCSAVTAFFKAYDSMSSSSEQINKCNKSLEHFDESTLPEDVSDMLKIARAVKSELPTSYRHDRDARQIEPELDARRQCTDLLSRDLLANFERDLALCFTPAARLSKLQTALNAAVAQHKAQVEGSAKLAAIEPEKPTDQDVQVFTTALTDWSQAVQDARRPLIEIMIEITEVMAKFDEAVKVMVEAKEDANNVALDGGKYHPSPALQAANRAYDYMAHLQSAVKTSINNGHATLSQDFSIEGDKLQSDATADAPNDLALQQAVRAALRKVGFALAQKRAAEVRRQSAIDQPTPLGQQEPNIDEVNGENFVRRFSQWQKAKEDQKAALEAKTLKIAGFKEQVDQRAAQVPQAALSLAEALAPLSGDQILSPELSVLARVAKYLYGRHKPVETAVAEPVAKPVEAPAASTVRKPLPPLNTHFFI